MVTLHLKHFLDKVSYSQTLLEGSQSSASSIRFLILERGKAKIEARMAKKEPQRLLKKMERKSKSVYERAFFFVFSSLLGVPSLTILILNTGNTIVKGIRDFTF